MAEAREFRESLAHRARLEQPTWRLAVPERLMRAEGQGRAVRRRPSAAPPTPPDDPTAIRHPCSA